nr:helix-turn-helix transcriptional regulator [Xenophilus azovorans]
MRGRSHFLGTTPYTSPTTDDLRRLKDALGFTGEQMAELASVADNSQWRKYTGGATPRRISPHMLFFIAARLELSADDLLRIGQRMQAIGADLDPSKLQFARSTS